MSEFEFGYRAVELWADPYPKLLQLPPGDDLARCAPCGGVGTVAHPGGRMRLRVAGLTHVIVGWQSRCGDCGGCGYQACDRCGTVPQADRLDLLLSAGWWRDDAHGNLCPACADQVLPAPVDVCSGCDADVDLAAGDPAAHHPADCPALGVAACG